MIEKPKSGGSYIRQKDGSLKRVVIKPAPAVPPEPTPAPAAPVEKAAKPAKPKKETK